MKQYEKHLSNTADPSLFSIFQTFSQLADKVVINFFNFFEPIIFFAGDGYGFHETKEVAVVYIVLRENQQTI